MTNRAIMRELRCHMIRRRRGIELRLMTAPAILRRACKLTVDMA